jgi:hypothetical protein
VSLGHALDFFLTFQVKGAGGGSDKTVGHFQYHVSTSTGGTLGDSTALHAVALSQGNHFFPV